MLTWRDTGGIVRCKVRKAATLSIPNRVHTHLTAAAIVSFTFINIYSKKDFKI